MYVGKASDLRRRLLDHARSDELRGIAGIRYEVLDCEAAALAREADILSALAPRNKAHVDDYFSYVSVTAEGLAFGSEGDYGCFPHLGRGALSEPGRACIDGFDALTTRP